jgi:hypothetical protein
MWFANLLKKYSLPKRASLEEIEKKATELLDNPLTVISGAELVLGRRVSGNREKEPIVLPLLSRQGLNGKDKFGLLLMERITEASIKAAKNSVRIAPEK